MTHRDLAKLYCQYIGQRGTEKQMAAIMKQLSYETLRRMCVDRGLLFNVPASLLQTIEEARSAQ